MLFCDSSEGDFAAGAYYDEWEFLSRISFCHAVAKVDPIKNRASIERDDHIARDDAGARRRRAKRRPGVSAAAAAPRRRASRPAPLAAAQPRGGPLTSSSTSPLPTRKPLLGRVKRCSSKCSRLLSLGTLRSEPGWHNTGYIFPDGFSSATQFRSSERIGEQVEHVCSVVGRGGAHWPLPTFVVTAADRPDEPLAARSATGAWSAVLARISRRITERIARGEDLPPPPRTAIAGPEYFGLTQHGAAIESLDPDRSVCALYWAGKAEREAFVAAYGDAPDRKVLQVSAAGSRAAAAPVATPAAAPAAAAAGGADNTNDDDSSEPQAPAEPSPPAPRRVAPPKGSSKAKKRTKDNGGGGAEGGRTRL